MAHGYRTDALALRLHGDSNLTHKQHRQVAMIRCIGPRFLSKIRIHHTGVHRVATQDVWSARLDRDIHARHVVFLLLFRRQP